MEYFRFTIDLEKMITCLIICLFLNPEKEQVILQMQDYFKKSKAWKLGILQVLKAL